MNKVLLLKGGLLLAMLILVACNNDDNGNMDEDDVVVMMPSTRSILLTNEQRDFVSKNNDFSIKLFKTINQQAEESKSAILSPISVTYVMGMLNDGADGTTAKEITSVLGFGDGESTAVNDLCKKLIEEAPEVDESVTLKIANLVATQNGILLEDQFKEDLYNFYLAETASLDFSSPNATNTINDWCNRQTSGMIPEITDELALRNAVLALVNAVYFKATWTRKFDTKKTKDEMFTREDGSKVKFPMMNQQVYAEYKNTGKYSVLRLPYGNSNMWSMYILLPNEGNTVNDIINQLSYDSWRTEYNSLKGSIVDVKVPRFKTESKYNLIPTISAMGAPTMFTNKADFTKISSNHKGLYVSSFIQKAAVEVNEEGTKAAAVTLATMSDSAAGLTPQYDNVDFHCDRPFIYLIQESSSGAIFFIGTFRGE